MFSKRPDELIEALKAAGPHYNFDIEQAPDGTTKIRMQNFQLRDFLEAEATERYYRAAGAKKFVVY
jgi:hypothetical protein